MGAARQKHAEATDAAVEAAEGAEATEKPAKTKEPKEPRRGIGTVAIEALTAGKTNEEALAMVKVEFPEANTTLASINWYRNNLRQQGKDIPTARALGAEVREQKKAARKAEKDAEKATKKAAREAAKKKTTTDSTEAMASAETAGAGEGESFLN